MSHGSGSRYWGVGLAWLFLVGCTTTIALQEPPALVTLDLAGGDQRRIVLESPFADHREPREDCDVQKGALPSAKKQLDCSQDALSWLPTHLAEALRTVGFRVLERTDPEAEAAVWIAGALETLDVEGISLFHSAIFEADVNVVLRVKSPRGGLDATRSFFVKTSRTHLVGGMGSLQTSLDEAAGRTIHDMVAAILSLLNRYPTLGRPSPPRAVDSVASEPDVVAPVQNRST